ncbi:hypothetical protein V6N13_064386 [Hibiscus sabdariffa]
MVQNSGTSHQEEQPIANTQTLQTEALIQEMQRLLREELEPIHKRTDQLEGSQARDARGVGRQSQQRNQNEVVEDNENEDFEHSSQLTSHRYRGQYDDNISNIKVCIPPFQGKTDPEAYLD